MIRPSQCEQCVPIQTTPVGATHTELAHQPECPNAPQEKN